MRVYSFDNVTNAYRSLHIAMGLYHGEQEAKNNASELEEEIAAVFKSKATLCKAYVQECRSVNGIMKYSLRDKNWFQWIANSITKTMKKEGKKFNMKSMFDFLNKVAKRESPNSRKAGELMDRHFILVFSDKNNDN